MKLPKVIRPEIEIEYKGLKGFILVLYGVLTFGVRRFKLNFSAGKSIIGTHTFIVIPRYKFTRR